MYGLILSIGVGMLALIGLLQYIHWVVRSEIAKMYGQLFDAVADMIADVIVANNERIEQDLIRLGVLPEENSHLLGEDNVS